MSYNKKFIESYITMKNMNSHIADWIVKIVMHIFATVNNDQELRKKTAKLWAELNNAPTFFLNLLTVKDAVLMV